MGYIWLHTLNYIILYMCCSQEISPPAFFLFTELFASAGPPAKKRRVENDVVDGEQCGVVCSIGSSADELINPKGRPPKIDGWKPEIMFLFEGFHVFFSGG